MDALILFVLPPLLGYFIYYLMSNDTKIDKVIQNIIEYVDNNTDKSKKKYKFWKLIEND